MEEAKICPVCGGKVTAKNRKYCSPKCSKEGYRRRQAKYSIKRYHTEKENQLGATKEPKGENQLERLARKAREAGMTYGQYVALEYAGRIQNARHKTNQSR